MADLVAHLKKEYYWAKRRLPALILLVLVLPLLFGLGTVVFQTVIPQDIPVAVVPQSDDVGDDELSIAEGSIALITDPVRVESEEKAMKMLNREQVYAVITVPPNITEDTSDPATFEFKVSGSVVPYKKPSQALAEVIGAGLNRVTDRPVNMDYEKVGDDIDLQGFLAPVVLILLTIIVGLGYLPRILADEREALPRLQIESSLTQVLTAKLCAATLLMICPLIVIGLVGNHFGYGMHMFNPAGVLAYLLFVVSLASLGMTVALLFGDRTATVINLGLSSVLISASNIVYPRGFFSPLRGEIAGMSPFHYAAIAIRGGLLRNMSIWQLRWELAWIAGAAVLFTCLLMFTATYTTQQR